MGINPNMDVNPSKYGSLLASNMMLHQICTVCVNQLHYRLFAMEPKALHLFTIICHVCYVKQLQTCSFSCGLKVLDIISLYTNKQQICLNASCCFRKYAAAYDARNSL